MDNKADYFVRESVIVLGFLSGLWIAVGIDPLAEVFKALATIINTLNPDSGFGFLFFVIPIIILFCSILGTYFMGGKLGLVAVGCGFFGGLLILISPIISAILFILGTGVGIVAVNVKTDVELGF